MDVRISYGINLGKVPEKIADLLFEFNVGEVGQLIGLARELIELSNADLAVPLIEQARSKLGDLDKTLNDSQMILKGYLNTAKTEEPTPLPPEEQDAG